jgi:hypothetical protein
VRVEEAQEERDRVVQQQRLYDDDLGERRNELHEANHSGLGN